MTTEAVWLVKCVICGRITQYVAKGQWRKPTSKELALCNFLDGLCFEHDLEKEDEDEHD